jgi:hypothetical protein
VTVDFTVFVVVIVFAPFSAVFLLLALPMLTPDKRLAFNEA